MFILLFFKKQIYLFTSLISGPQGCYHLKLSICTYLLPLDSAYSREKTDE